MDAIVCVDLESFDFGYWNNSRIAVLNALRKHGRVDNVNTLCLMTGLTYSLTWNIVVDFQNRKLVSRDGRIIVLSPDWKKIFTGE